MIIKILKMLTSGLWAQRKPQTTQLETVLPHVIRSSMTHLSHLLLPTPELTMQSMALDGPP